MQSNASDLQIINETYSVTFKLIFISQSYYTCDFKLKYILRIRGLRKTWEKFKHKILDMERLWLERSEEYR